MTTKAMRPFTSTITLDEARGIIARAIRPIERIEQVRLSESNGRVLARSVTSNIDVPPFSRAAMDGYAVHAADTTGATRATPRTLRCVEQIFTGQTSQRTVGNSECAEVATGAPLPPGADAVVIVEDTEADASGNVQVFAAVQPRQNVGARGADISTGQVVVEEAAVLTASRIGALAALGTTAVDVYAKPTVAILSTGDEIVEPGEPLTPGHIYDINKFTLSAVINDNGGMAVPRRVVADSIEELSRAVEDCLAEDLLVFSGGSSVGRRDLIMDVISSQGEILFHGIAVKPGKPTALGRIRGKLVFGMPGYPTSCLSNAYILLAPTLRQIARLPPQTVRSVSLPLGARVNSVPGRHQFYTVRVADGVAMPAFKASGDITSMSQADGYIEIPADTRELDAGNIVEVKLF